MKRKQNVLSNWSTAERKESYNRQGNMDMGNERASRHLRSSGRGSAFLSGER